MSLDKEREPVILMPGEGRSYEMGRIRACFKADDEETNHQYSISEWWLEANTTGPGPHSHKEDDIFFVIEGTMSILVGDRWFDASAGSFVLVPGGVVHDFQNRSESPAGVLNLFTPGGFEKTTMPKIAQWYRENPPGDVFSR